jgi:hypothetical protein
VRRVVLPKRPLRRGSRLAGAAAACLALVALTAGGAWSASKPGHGPPLLKTVHVGVKGGTKLYPGGRGDVVIALRNPNRYPVRVTAIVGRGAVRPDPRHRGCRRAAVRFVPKRHLRIVVRARRRGVNGRLVVRLRHAATMSRRAPNACQGASFALAVRISGRRLHRPRRHHSSHSTWHHDSEQSNG